jgi:hypothetical protein
LPSLVSSGRLMPSLVSTPALVIELGEITKLGDQYYWSSSSSSSPMTSVWSSILVRLTKTDGYLLWVQVPVPNLARNGHLHPHQAPAGRYLSTFMGTCWWVLGTCLFAIPNIENALPGKQNSNMSFKLVASF